MYEMKAMTKPFEIPDCHHPTKPTLVPPCSPTPSHPLYLSNLDDQKFLRFSIKYLYLYKRSIATEALRDSLSRVLVEYYPLAGRLRASEDGGDKLEVDCNGEGALFAEGYVDMTADEFLEASSMPNKSWRKLLFRVDANTLVDVPPLLIQVTHLSCGGMILCTGISHCLCDGIGTAQFLNAWALATAKPSSALPVSPFHGRDMLKPRSPTKIAFYHPEFTQQETCEEIAQLLHSQPLSPISLTFTPSQILHLKKLCVPSLKCTSFEVLASHIWRAWLKSLAPPPSLEAKLLFSVNVRQRLDPSLPRGYYGNGFVLGCAESSVGSLVSSNSQYGVRLVQKAKERLNDAYIRSMIDLLEERKVKPDMSLSLVISQWSKLGLEDLDFGEGLPLHMGPLASEIYCVLLPVPGELHTFTVAMSVPQCVADKFEHCLGDLGEEENGELGCF